MSFDMTIYTRDRPLVDETQESGLERSKPYTWDDEQWNFGGMAVSVRPYRFRRDADEDLAWHFADSEPPAWVDELRWRLHGSGRANDEFLEWMRDRARAARGVVYCAAFDEPLEIIEHHYEQAWIAENMIEATRPIHCDHDDRASWDLRRESDGGATEDSESFGAPLVNLVEAGVRVSWDAAQFLYLATHDEPGEIELRLFAPIRGARDSRRFARLTKHPDARVDALLRDPEGAAVLRDLLLVRNEPVDPMLHDLVGGLELPCARLRDSCEVRNELMDLWERVIELDPALDLAALGDFARPRMGAPL